MSIRYYKGKYKIKKLLKGAGPRGKSLFRVLEFMKVGHKKLGYRIAYPGEIITLFNRQCQINKK